MEGIAGAAQTAILGDWSWLNKVRVTGPDAARFLNFATVKDISRQQIGQIMYTPMVNEDGKVAIEGLTLRSSATTNTSSRSPGRKAGCRKSSQLTDFDVTLEDVTPDYTCYRAAGSARDRHSGGCDRRELPGPALLALAPNAIRRRRRHRRPAGRHRRSRL